ncbi:translation initiation factor eIF-3b [Conidiobolus coronatus NRRL 28638]|uniref:Eukaryotic translation initiation factor 3 subunit B n=1 Tax=Conidiobolus coronatus (strain ATCC 28846 / CBS 209.66 / NRRL 28638) TaxID=796925 RepID=A0A137P1X4_CONC2|nr:translation initiation factor eIF-3b [Conidiobolus coronatus NRRL 28638]|eukprot:KXN69037.1 translation initiation factor eIF-3b [Conidiobolus coronatus NRRL 28638]
MAPAIDFKNIASEADLDFSSLDEKYSLELDTNFDNIAIVDNIPVIDESKEEKLGNVLRKIFKASGTIKENGIYMPKEEVNGKLTSKGFAFLEFETPEQVAAAIKNVNNYAMDKKHVLLVNKINDIEKYTSLEDKYVEPHFEEFQPKEHLLGHLKDPSGRDQYATLIKNMCTIEWNNKSNPPEKIESRPNWTESYVLWSPKGTYLTTVHRQGIALWGGPSWKQIVKFSHPGVSLIDYSPNENYVVTWSNQPIVAGTGATPNQPSPFGADEEGHHFCIWDIKTGLLLRTFPNLPANDDGPVRISWPAFKWSPSDKYFARIHPKQQISIYEAPSMSLLGKKSHKVDGVVDFSWAPATHSIKGKAFDEMMVYWTPEIGNQPARVSLLRVPDKEVLRNKTLFNVSDCYFHWHPLGELLAVRVNRHAKNKKSQFSNLEIFRVREKDIPVEVIELKDVAIQFSWEPTYHYRFVILTSSDPNPAPSASGAAPQPVKTTIHFYKRERAVNGSIGASKDVFRHLATFDKKTANTVLWSPRGRHLVFATLKTQSIFDIEFWDVELPAKYPADKKNSETSVHLVNTVEHYGLTQLEWDPSGRYVISSASVWQHGMEHGYTLWDMNGNQLIKKVIEDFRQILWRPRPKSLLDEKQKREIEKKLDTYSVEFDKEDYYSRNAASAALLKKRNQLYAEWNEFRSKVEAERQQNATESKANVSDSTLNEEIEEWVEEVVEETEEILE